MLTTIPPLGLAASDGREQIREQINADITANYCDPQCTEGPNEDHAVTRIGNLSGVDHVDTSMPGLILTELTVADAATYYALLDRNRQHLSRYGDYQDEANATPAWTTAHLTEPAPDRFGIWLHDRLIGRVDLVHAAPPRYGLGYWLSQDSTGHGYATAACAAIIRHARTAHHATDIFAGVTHGNDPSIAVLRRLDFQPITKLDHYTRFHLPLGPTSIGSSGDLSVDHSTR